MRIVLYTSGFFEYVVELANHLFRQGCDVVLMISDTVDPRVLSLADPGVTLSCFRNVDFVSYRENIKWLLDIRRRLRAINPDVVHVQAYGHPWLLPLFLSLPTYRLMNTVHDPSPHSGDEVSLVGLERFRWTAWLINWLCAGVFVHGVVLRSLFCARYRYPPSRVHVIPMGNFSCYARLSDGKEFSEHSEYVLFFGRIWPYKGLDLFLEAGLLVLEKHPQAKFVIAGRGEDMATYKQFVARQPERFFFYEERIDVAKVASLFERCSFTVLPYRDATQSAVVTTAFGLGRTVIATRVGALPEIVKHGENGLIVEPNDVQALADAICGLLSNPAERSRLAENALRCAQTTLSWDTVARMTRDVYGP
jgi:glycosyltransferase involved in cell wall biosynthesis